MSPRSPLQRYTLLAAVLVTLGVAGAPAAFGQIFDFSFIPTTPADWNVATNWREVVSGANAVPDATTFDVRALITTGGTANVSAPSPPSPGAITIQNGTININSGATLSTMVPPGLLLDGSVFVSRTGTSNATLNVLPGATLSAVGPLMSAANAANLIVVGGAAAGTATVNVPAASFNGTTRVFPNAAFTSAGTVTFGAGGIYNPQINGTSAPSLTIGQNAVLAGTLNATFTGAAPTVGATWSLMQADSIIGNFGTITSTLTLPANQRLLTRVVPIAGARRRLDLELSEVLVLNVNRDTGVVSITNPGGGNIALDAYSITSSQGRMVGGPWNSLADQGALGGGWNEAGASAASVSELRPTGNGTAAGGANVSLGGIYNPLAGTFAATVTDVGFQYSDRDGRIIDGIVNYSGTRLNNLLLQIDPTTGRGTIRNTSATTVNIDGYAISSTASLTPGTWTSLDDQNAAGGDWLEMLNPSAALIGEVKTLGSTTLAPSASFDLGTIFNPASARNLSFEFLQAGELVATVGAVVYEAAGDADFDNDGDVDGNDFLRWQRGVGTNSGATNAQGDANGDGAVNGADLALWRSRFGMSSAQAAVAAVPEPASLALAALCVLGIASRRRSK
jgi:hypothetical protein